MTSSISSSARVFTPSVVVSARRAFVFVVEIRSASSSAFTVARSRSRGARRAIGANSSNGSRCSRSFSASSRATIARVDECARARGFGRAKRVETDNKLQGQARAKVQEEFQPDAKPSVVQSMKRSPRLAAA